MANDDLATELAASGFDVVGTDALDHSVRADAILLYAGQIEEAARQVGDASAADPDAWIFALFDEDNLAERLACFGAGADDCLVRPFETSEIAAKLRAIERRKARLSSVVRLKPGEATVDPATLELRVGDRVHGLTKRESELLVTLAAANGEAMAREQILKEAWGAPRAMTSNSVDVYVGYARRKLALLDADVDIVAVRGVGFRLTASLAPQKRR